MRNKTREDWIAEFNEKAGNKTFREGGSVEQFITGFSEELIEFNKALADYLTEVNDGTRQELVKEWSDVQVTLSNLAWFFDIYGEGAFLRVAENNLTKLQGGELLKREDGKILKPEGYVKPDMTGL